MTYSTNSNPLNFEENMEAVIGLSKGTYLGVEPLPTKQELLDELKEEMATLDSREANEQRKMILKIEKMTDEEFLIYYDKIPPLELVNDEIIHVNKSKIRTK